MNGTFSFSVLIGSYSIVLSTIEINIFHANYIQEELQCGVYTSTTFPLRLFQQFGDIVMIISVIKYVY